MMELLVFGMLCGFVSGIYVIGLLSKSKKKIKNISVSSSSDQLSFPMQEGEKTREMAAAHR
jgi:hypothetical protein